MATAPLAAAPLLAACASLHERPVTLGEIDLTEADVLQAEQAEFDYARQHGGRVKMTAVEAVDQLRCVILDRVPNIPNCRYRLFYTDLSGADAVRIRRRQFLQNNDGRWEKMIVVPTY